MKLVTFLLLTLTSIHSAFSEEQDQSFQRVADLRVGIGVPDVGLMAVEIHPFAGFSILGGYSVNPSGYPGDEGDRFLLAQLAYRGTVGYPMSSSRGLAGSKFFHVGPAVALRRVEHGRSLKSVTFSNPSSGGPVYEYETPEGAWNLDLLASLERVWWYGSPGGRAMGFSLHFDIGGSMRLSSSSYRDYYPFLMRFGIGLTL